MLHIIGLFPAVTGTLIVDPYIPFDFRADEGMLLPYRWRLGNFRHSLFEVALEKETGIVYGAKLTASGKRALTELPLGYETTTRKTGLPIIDAVPLTEAIWDEPRDFSLLHKNEAVYVVFDPAWNPDTCMQVDRVAFFGAKGVLCGVGFFQLTLEEISMLKKYFLP